MGVALLAAKRSKDPKTQVGACVVSPDKQIFGVGYNAMPYTAEESNDEKYEWKGWDQNNEADLKKHLYGKILKNKLRKSIYIFNFLVCHAEMHAIVNRIPINVINCTIYVTFFPCNECAKLIIQSGIKKVIYLSNKYHYRSITKLSKLMLNEANVDLIQHIPQRQSIAINFN